MNYYRSTKLEARGFNEDEAIKLMLDEINETKTGRATIKGIEIGVGNGERVHTFCAHEKVRHTGIDNLEGDGQNHPTNEKMEALEKQYSNFFFMEGDSSELADKFKDKKYDYVFIDGGHSYQQAEADFDNYATKVKSGGFILIHDSRADEGIVDAVTKRPVNWHPGPTKLKNDIDAEGLIQKVGAVYSLTIYQV